MTEDGPKNRNVQVSDFNGKNKNITIWWKRFCAYAILKKYKKELEETFDLFLDPEKLTGTNLIQKEKEQRIKQNTEYWNRGIQKI